MRPKLQFLLMNFTTSVYILYSGRMEQSTGKHKVVGYWFNEQKCQKFGVQDLEATCRWVVCLYWLSAAIDLTRLSCYKKVGLQVLCLQYIDFDNDFVICIVFCNESSMHCGTQRLHQFLMHSHWWDLVTTVLKNTLHLFD